MPLATSASLSKLNGIDPTSTIVEAREPSLLRPQRPRYHRRKTSSNNSVISMMISANDLKSCDQVHEMMQECLMNKDKGSFMCQTAQKYLGGCMN
mmetsp:Transcript_6124/g.9567  ORF Transcript_6124/g.9567 Transcript_6124/m.9567 type:complete len:95 (+) Transcript_6124:81-365(+)